MNKEFVPYEQALALKGIEFDEPCLAFYYDKTKFLKLGENPEWLINKHKASYIFGSNKHDVTLAPTFSQAFRWFRENYKLRGHVISDYDMFSYQIYGLIDNEFNLINGGSVNKEYEEAELECLVKLIGIVKEKKNG